VGKQQKLIDKLLSKSKNFTFNESVTLLESLGFVRSNKGRTSGSRVMFSRGRTDFILHRPHPQKELKIYQILDMIGTLKKEGLI
jgi:hypothetical protein